MKRALLAVAAVAALTACETEPVPANAPPNVTSACVPFRAGSHFARVGTTGGKGLWVYVYHGTGVLFYGWVPSEDSYCGTPALNQVWEAHL